jgi:hypothetical protein
MVARLLSFCASSRIAAGSAHASTRTRGQPSGPTLPATDSRHGSGENHSTMDGAGSFVPPLIAGALHPKGSRKAVRRRPVKEQEAARGRGKQGQVRGSTVGSIPSFESNEKKSSPTSVLRGPSELSTTSYGHTPGNFFFLLCLSLSRCATRGQLVNYFIR